MQSSIYKKGQGYWTRLMSTVGFGLLVLLGAVWLFQIFAGSDDRVKELLFLDLLDRGFYIARRGYMALSMALTEADLRAPRALYVGRISRDRGLPLLEHLAAAGVPLTLVGPRDHEPAATHAQLELRPAVAHAAVPAELARGALALMPYQADLRHAASISPIKLFEAMAAGRLVIASDLAPLREIVRDGENGLLVPPEDPDAWLGAIGRVRKDPAAALAMAEAGRQTASAYGWDARARRLLALSAGAPASAAEAA